MASKLEVKSVEGYGRWIRFMCPGCKESHIVYVGKAFEPAWGWNGNDEKPTFTPSILIRGEHRCHSFARDGQIQFLSDCHHSLARKTMDLPDWAEK